MNIPYPPAKRPLPKHAKKVFTGEIFDVYQWEQEMYDGSTVIFEKIKRADTVSVIPITTEQKILISHEEQPGLKPFYGVFGGRIEPEENPLSAAKRELLEETGYLAHRLRPIMSFYASPGILSEKLHAFAATELQKATASPELGEDIELLPMPLEAAIQMIHHGEIQDAKTIVTLMAYHRWGVLAPIPVEGGIK